MNEIPQPHICPNFRNYKEGLSCRLMLEPKRSCPSSYLDCRLFSKWYWAEHFGKKTFVRKGELNE